MLQGTAAADSEVGTFMDYAIGRGLEHFQQLGIVVLAMAACTPEADALAW
jgi:hypothetical protein